MNSFFKTAGKLFLGCAFPMFLGFCLLYLLFGCLIDLYSYCKSANLSSEDKKSNSISRENNRLHTVLDVLFDYLKAIFSW